MSRKFAALHRALAAKEPRPEIAAAHIRFAEEHESKATAAGWADHRLGQAYDLIDAVLTENNNPESGLHERLKTARDEVEAADVELERLSK